MKYYLKKHKEEKKRYDAMSPADKSTFRAQFFGRELKVAEEQLSATRSLSIADRNTGIFYTPKKIAVEMGHDPVAASKYCMGCLRVGPSEYMIDV